MSAKVPRRFGTWRRGTRLAKCCLLGLALIGILATALIATRLGAASGASRTIYAYVTYYGWYDNTPPGCATSYSGCAGGTGTYAHPITFATDTAELPVGTRVYYPTVQKYFVMGDDCTECDADWSKKGPNGGPRFAHVDLWIGGKGGNEFNSINCENALTQSSANGGPLRTPLIVNPPGGLPVSTEPLFDAQSGHCYGEATTSTSYGRYRNAQTGKCLVDPSGAGTSGTLVTTAACSGVASEDFAFEGAFLVVNGQCLEIAGAEPGSRLEVWACNGNAREQWAINSNGTISWVQYGDCVADVAGIVKLLTCSSASRERWTYTSEPES